MPSVRIVTGEWARDRCTELIEAVQAAMVSTIKIPDWDRDITVDVYDATRRAVPTGKSDRFTRVEIKLFSGRSIEAKRALYRAIVDNLAALGVPELETKIILVEVPTPNWGLRGGIAGSEIEIGFKLDV
ncbi:tautomerase family protein [Rhodopseudomonas palustris]|uniref:4-oxalocrotonate tautomerase n=1 Tax=Rhodopseudomonas palustris (strain BisB18) TaxID=316056 RepID=Q215U6_RHOPB